MHSGVDWRSLYPFESHWLDLGPYHYHYVDEGQGDALLLVHGNPTWSFYWRNIIKALSPRYRVIAVDHIGCGLSDKPRDYPYCLARHIGNLRQLVERLDLKNITLLGHDWGGPIGLGAAVVEPERFARFVMFNTAAFPSGRMPLRIRVCRTPVLGRLAVQGLNAFARGALRMAVAHPERLTPEVRAGILAPYDTWAHRQAIYRFVEDIPMSIMHPSYTILCGVKWKLHELTDRPWLFVWGMRDWCFTPHFLERFLTFVPSAEVHRLADAGHWVIEDACDEVIPIVERFLERNSGQGPRTRDEDVGHRGHGGHGDEGRETDGR